MNDTTKPLHRPTQALIRHQNNPHHQPPPPRQPPRQQRTALFTHADHFLGDFRQHCADRHSDRALCPQLPPFSSPVESTENALVRGQTTIISPQLSGYVFEVPVQDFQFVKAGDLLVRLDDRIYRQHLDQSLAQLGIQKASLANNLQQRRSAEATIAQRKAAPKTASLRVAISGRPASKSGVGHRWFGLEK